MDLKLNTTPTMHPVHGTGLMALGTKGRKAVPIVEAKVFLVDFPGPLKSPALRSGP